MYDKNQIKSFAEKAVELQMMCFTKFDANDKYYVGLSTSMTDPCGKYFFVYVHTNVDGEDKCVHYMFGQYSQDSINDMTDYVNSLVCKCNLLNGAYTLEPNDRMPNDSRTNDSQPND